MKKLTILLSVTGLLAFYSCKDDPRDKEQSSVAFYLTDAPAAEGYKAVNVDIQAVQYLKSGTTEFLDISSVETWVDLPISPTQVDLLRLANGRDSLLASINLDKRMVISAIRLILGDHNTLTLADGTIVPLDTPSGQTSGLKIQVRTTGDLPDNYRIVIDFDASHSIVVHGNGTYALKPVLRAYITANTSSVFGRLTPDNIRSRIFTVTPAGDTLATISDTTMTNYFMLHGLFSGTYDIKVQDLNTLQISTLINQLSVSDNSDVDLGTLALPVD